MPRTAKGRYLARETTHEAATRGPRTNEPSRPGRAGAGVVDKQTRLAEMVTSWEPAFAYSSWMEATAGIFATEGRKNGGADGGRTRDLLNAIQARSQLRHSPTIEGLIVAKGDEQVNKRGGPGEVKRSEGLI